MQCGCNINLKDCYIKKLSMKSDIIESLDALYLRTVVAISILVIKAILLLAFHVLSNK